MDFQSLEKTIVVYIYVPLDIIVGNVLRVYIFISLGKIFVHEIRPLHRPRTAIKLVFI